MCASKYNLFGWVPISIAIMVGSAGIAQAAVILSASPSPATFGAPVTLTATITPLGATGKVTFYDGAVVLGTAFISGGTATLRVPLNASGQRSLICRYLGDSNNPPAVSPAIGETVNSMPAYGFIPSNINVNGSVTDFAIADFNGDGIPDVAVSSYGNLIYVVLGNGNGTFGTPIVTLGGVTGQFSSIVAGDFNGDGKVDVALGNQTLGNLSVYLGNGDGTFGTATSYPAGAGPMVVADFNLDGIPDIVVVNSTQTFTILLGKGDGTFGTPTPYGAGGFPSAVAVGDLNGDGKPDLVSIVPTPDTEGSLIVVLLGNGDGTFAAVKSYTLYASLGGEQNDTAILLADFDGDGKLDLAIAPDESHGIWVCLGKGDGTFAGPVQYNAPSGQDDGFGVGIAAADVNGDGKLDVVADTQLQTFLGTGLGNELQTFYGNGDGTFQPIEILAPPQTHILHKLVAADLNGDGRVDLMAAGYDGNNNLILKLFSGGVMPELRISATHSGNVSPGQTQAAFSIVVSNTTGASATSGTVTVNYQLNGFMNLDLMSGSGWTCSDSASTCSRSDSLAPGGSYPAITVAADVQSTAPTITTANAAIVSGGGSEIGEASDTVNIVPLSPGCTFSLSAQSFSPGGGAAGNSVTVITSPGCAWVASSNSSWLTITSGTSGSGTGPVSFQILANPVSQSRTGTLIIAGLTFTVMQAAPTLAPASVIPGSGSGTAQTFTLTFTDQAGFSDLAVLDILMNDSLDGRQACYVALVPSGSSGGYLYLVDDAGDGGYVSGSPMLLPSSNNLQNSQCTISAAGSSVSASGNTLTLNMAVTFASGFAGNRVLYAAARSNTQNSGWQAIGTWNVPGTSPTGPSVGGMSPARTTNSVGSYTFTFTDTNGYSDLGVLNILINGFLDGMTACYVAYVPTSATTGNLFLVDDAGDGRYSSGSPAAVPGNYLLENSQCTVGVTSVSAIGNTLTLTLQLNFNIVNFMGNQIFYMAARNGSTGNSGWQAVGSVTVP